MVLGTFVTQIYCLFIKGGVVNINYMAICDEISYVALYITNFDWEKIFTREERWCRNSESRLI